MRVVCLKDFMSGLRMVDFFEVARIYEKLAGTLAYDLKWQRCNDFCPEPGGIQSLHMLTALSGISSRKSGSIC